MFVQRLSIKGKLSLSLGLLTLLVMLVIGWSVQSLLDSRNQFDTFVHGLKARADVAERIRTAVDRRAIAARNLALVTSSDDIAIEKSAAMNAQNDVTQNYTKLQAMVAPDQGVSDEERTLVSNIGSIESRYQPVALSILNLALDGHRDAAVEKIKNDCRPLLAALVKATNDYSTFTHEHEEQQIQAMATRTQNARNALIVIGILALSLAITVGMWLTRTITRPILSAVAIARTVATGDLTSRIAVTGHDETRDLLEALSGMNERLNETVSAVRESTSNVETAAREIAAGNADLSQRTEEQASSIQQTAATMSELTTMVKQTTDNAQQARILAVNASAVVQQGRDEVGRVVASMGDIDVRSRKISDITSMIDGIAFQTNILALNAAVEAARAGEDGRGFAVVAGEVRNLAQRSAAAAKDIKDLISASVESIRTGTLVAANAGQTMDKVNQAVARVTDIMEEIASASTEQHRGIEQVNISMGHMDDVTQQNTALVEEASAAAQSLEDQGRSLQHAVGFFTVRA